MVGHPNVEFEHSSVELEHPVHNGWAFEELRAFKMSDFEHSSIELEN